MRNFRKKILSILFFVFIFSNLNFANLSADDSSGGRGFWARTISSLLNSLHLKKGGTIGYECLKDLPIDIWDAEIINAYQQSFSERELLDKLCALAQVLLLGNEDWHRNLSDKVIKHIISLDRQVNPEKGLVDFYQILNSAYNLLKFHPEVRTQRKKFCCDKTNSKCFFCQLINERILHDRDDIVMPKSTLVELNEIFIRSAKEGNLNLLKMLLLHGVDINTVDNEGETALHWAAAKGKFNIASFLVQNGANTAIQDLAGYTPLIRAISKNKISLANFLLDFCDAACINIKNEVEDTALLWAIVKNAVDLTEKLLKKGAKIDIYNVFANSPKSNALRKNNEKMIRLLKKWGVKF
ncbi:MAG: ankyrin repeat domain-containing protein [Candidatus Babeliales bacterium]